MNTDEQEAIIRLESWVRTYREHKQQAFITDLETVLFFARQSMELQAKLEKCKAFFNEEIDTITKKWNKLYLEAKEACK